MDKHTQFREAVTEAAARIFGDGRRIERLDSEWSGPTTGPGLYRRFTMTAEFGPAAPPESFVVKGGEEGPPPAPITYEKFDKIKWLGTLADLVTPPTAAPPAVEPDEPTVIDPEGR
jgi:hypothetical protein